MALLHVDLIESLDFAQNGGPSCSVPAKYAIILTTMDYASNGESFVAPQYIFGTQVLTNIANDVRIRKTVAFDIKEDVRFVLGEIIDVEQDVRIRKALSIDVSNDVRFSFGTLVTDDIAIDMRTRVASDSNMYNDVRIVVGIFGDVATDIRTQKEISFDISNDSRIAMLMLYDSNNDIRTDRIFYKDFYGECVPQKDSIQDFYCNLAAVTQAPVYIPTILAATDMQKGDLIKVSWSADSNYGYNVYKTAPSGRLKMNSEPVIGEYEYLVGDLIENTAYTFVVVGVNAGGTESADSASKSATPTYPSLTGPSRIKKPIVVVSVGGVPITNIMLDTVEDGYGTTPATATFRIPTNNLWVTTPTFGSYVTVTVNSRVIFRGYIQRIERNLSSSGKTVTYTAYSGITSYNDNFTSWGWIQSIRASHYGLDITDQTELQAWETIWNSEGNYKVYYNMNSGALEKYQLGTGGTVRSVIFGKNIIDFNIFENRLDQINSITVRGGPTKHIYNFVPVLFKDTDTTPSFYYLIRGGHNISDIQLQAYQTITQPEIHYDTTVSVVPSDVGLVKWDDDTVEAKQTVRGWTLGEKDWVSAGSQVDYNYKEIGGEDIPTSARVVVTKVARVVEPDVRGFTAKRGGRTTIEDVNFGFVSVAMPNTWRGAAYRMAYSDEAASPPTATAGGGTPARSITDAGLAGVRNDRDGTNTTGQMSAAMHLIAQGELEKNNRPQISGRIKILGDETMGLKTRVNVNGTYLDVVRVVHNFSNGYTTEIELTNEKFRVNVDTQVARLRKVRVERKVQSLESIAKTIQVDMSRNDSTNKSSTEQEKEIEKGPFGLWAD